MRLEIAQPNHARTIAAIMRERDRDEIRAGWGMEPEIAIAIALGESYYARTMFYHLEPLCIYGLAPLMLLGGSSRFWIFSTSAIDRHPLAFARASRRARDLLFEHCLLITNLIDIDDAPAMKWMHWLGASRTGTPIYERGGRRFAQFALSDTRGAKCQQG